MAAERVVGVLFRCVVVVVAFDALCSLWLSCFARQCGNPLLRPFARVHSYVAAAAAAVAAVVVPPVVPPDRVPRAQRDSVSVFVTSVLSPV